MIGPPQLDSHLSEPGQRPFLKDYDDRDLVIEALAKSEAELRDELIVMTADRDAYCMLAHQAIHALHDLTRERERIREEQARLLDEYRALRVQSLGGKEAT